MGPRRKTGRGEQEEEATASKSEPNSSSCQVPTTASDRQVDHEGASDEEDGIGSASDGELMIDDDQNKYDSDESDDKVKLTPTSGTMTRRQSKQAQQSPTVAAEVKSPPSIPNSTANTSTEQTPDSPTKRQDKNKNRTCSYCGVVKPTPAALIRHLRKHTGEKPFVCSLTPPQAVSESTKSLLRETLESSRKAKDESSLGQQGEDAELGDDLPPEGGSDRLSTPNLVNLLTSDIGIKMAQAAAAGTNSPRVTIKSESPSETVQLTPTPQQENLVVKQEDQAEDLSMSAPPTVPVVKKSPQSNNTTPGSVSRNTSMERKLKCEFCAKTFKHEISRANHTRTAHGIVVNYMDNPEPSSSSSSQQQQQQQQQQAFFEHFKLQQQKQQMKNMKSPQAQSTTQLPLSAVLSLMGTGVKQGNGSSSPHQYKQDMPTDLSLSRKIKETQYALVNQEVIKADLPTVGVTAGNMSNGEKDGPLLDESNTLPYHVTSKMAQDFNLEELSTKEEEWPVLAEDGGQRRLRVSVTKESVLATRLDGINSITGRRATVFKCHLCHRVFSSLLRFTHHLPSHHDTEVQTYDCRYCEASFRSHIQIVKHLQCHREKLTGTNQTGSSALLLEEFNRKHKQDVAEISTTVNSPNTSSSSSSSSLNSNKTNTFGNLPHIFSPVLSEDATDKISNKAKYTSLRKNLVSPDPHQAVDSDSNNNISLSRSRNIPTNSKSSASGSSTYGSPGLYTQGDTMKAIDLRRGEEVEVRMNSDPSDSDALRQRHALVQHYQLQAIMMMKAAEMAGTGGLPGSAGHPNLTLTQEQLLERAKNLRALSELAARGNRVIAPQGIVPMTGQSSSASKPSGMEDLSKHRKRKLEGEEARSRKRREAQEVEDARQRRERENCLRLEEQAQLKEKLLQEGMGDVTVVLPDAPPMEATDLSMSAQPLALTGTSSSSSSSSISASTLALIKDSVQPLPPPAGVGFMARKSGGSAVKTEIQSPSVSTVTSSASRIDTVLKKEYGSGGSPALDGERTILTIDLTKAGMKRPMPGTGFIPVTSSPSKPAGSTSNTLTSAGPPPAKSRRKAHKPQRINHCLEETDCGDIMEPTPVPAQNSDNKATTSSSANNSANSSNRVTNNVGQSSGSNTSAASSKSSIPSKKNENFERKEDKVTPMEQQKAVSVPAGVEKDVAENLSTTGVSVSSINPSVSTAVPATSTPASNFPNGAAPGLVDAAALQSQLGQQQVLAGLMALGALGGAMPAPTVTPTATANASGDLVRKNLEMMLARAAQGGANALFGSPVNAAAAAAAPLFMSRYLMAGLANFGNMAALNGGVTPAAVPGAGLFGATNPAAVYSALAAAAATNNASTDSTSNNNVVSDTTNTSSTIGNNTSNGETIAIDLSRDSKKSTGITSNTTTSNPSTANLAHHINKVATSVSSSSSSSTATTQPQSLVVNGTMNSVSRKSSSAMDESDTGKQNDSAKQRKTKPLNFTRSISLDPAALENNSGDSDLPLSLTTNNKSNKVTTAAADFSKTSFLSVQVSQSSNLGNGSSWKPDDADSSEENPPENFLSVTVSKSQGSSPSPVPSPTSSDTSADKKSSATTTSLSRTHSRLSVVNEPVDRNSLCKPKVLEDGRSVYSCAICHKHFLSLSDINRHMDFHEDIRPYKCQYCDYYARTNSQLKVHKLRHEGVREFCCRVCNYKGVTQSDLNRHMKSQVHLLRSNNVCPSCGEGFVTPKALRDHQGSCTGQADKSMEEDGIMGLGDENGTDGVIGSRGMVADIDDEMGYNEDDDDEYEQEERLNMEENGIVVAV